MILLMARHNAMTLKIGERSNSLLLTDPNKGRLPSKVKSRL